MQARYAGRRVSESDLTTATIPTFVDATRSSSWYLVVSTSAEVRSRVVPLVDSGDVVFGRVATSDVAIDHEGVSRRHAIFKRRGDVVTVEDLDSRNGTLVNGA